MTIERRDETDVFHVSALVDEQLERAKVVSRNVAWGCGGQHRAHHDGGLDVGVVARVNADRRVDGQVGNRGLERVATQFGNYQNGLG